MDTTIAFSDSQLIRWLSGPLKNTRRQRGEYLLQLPLADRLEASLAASRGNHHLEPEGLVEALAEVVSTHPNRRPVPCGGRYFPCPLDENATGSWGVIDTQDPPGGIDWVTWEGHPSVPKSWSSFERARDAAAFFNQAARGGRVVGISQMPWEPSIVRPGDRIQGKCVTMGGQRVGHVLRPHGPIKTPDCGGYRYVIQCDDGTRAIVFAELLM